MPAIIAICWGVVSALLMNVVSRVITAIGFGTVTFAGMTLLLNNLKASIIANAHSLPAAMVQIVSLLGLGNAITITLSALVIRATLNGMDSAGNYVATKWSPMKSN